MECIQFQPWVGTSYTKGLTSAVIPDAPAIRVMVLGESHYCAKASDATPRLTIDIIEDFIDPDSEHEGYKNTYTKFERALAGKVLNAKERMALWNHLLFYNYVQFPISGARQSPTTEEFRQSDSAFFEVLEKYRPHCIIAWGMRLYNNLPDCGRQLPDLKLPDGDSVEIWEYELTDGCTVPVLPIYHPSSAFSPDYWHQVIQSFIKNKVL